MGSRGLSYYKWSSLKAVPPDGNCPLPFMTGGSGAGFTVSKVGWDFGDPLMKMHPPPLAIHF